MRFRFRVWLHFVVAAVIGGGVLSDRLQPFSVPEHELNFAHFADGLGLFSQLILVNPGPDIAEARLTLADGAGAPLTVDLNGTVVSGSHVETLPGGSVARLTTDGQGDLVIGSVQVHSNVRLAGVLLFGGSFGMAGVGSSQALTAGLLAPVQVSSASQINTGIALMNPSDAPMEAEVGLFDIKGLPVSMSQLSLPAGGHLARFLDQIEWDPQPDLAEFRGLLRLDLAGGEVAATVLQSRPGEFATFPVVPLAPSGEPGGQNELFFAQFAEGQGLLQSQLLLLNLDAEEAIADLRLNRSDGTPMSVDLNGAWIEGQAVVRIAPGGLAVVSTDGEGPEVTVGSARLQSPQRLAGVVLFSGAVGAAGVGSSLPADQGFLAPVETGGDVNAGFAVMNLEEFGVEVDLELLDDAGTLVASGRVTLPPNGQLARFVDQIKWDAAVDFSNFRGQLKATVSGRVAAMMLRTSPGQFATLPVVVR